MRKVKIEIDVNKIKFLEVGKEIEIRSLPIANHFDELSDIVEQVFQNKEVKNYICQRDEEVLMYHYDEPKHLEDSFIVNIELSKDF